MAVTVAILSVVLLGIGAFTIDFGMSYADTRQLQTSADAAALAAANYLKTQTGTCPTLVADASVINAARDKAEYIRTRNRPGSSVESMQVTCVDGNKSLQVRYVSGGSTPSFLGGIFGKSSPYTSSRPATALVEVARTGIGVRPYAICASQIPSNALQSGVVFKMQLPASGNTTCPDAGSSGNWWTVDCPEAGSNGTDALADKTVNGCTLPITIVPDQVPAPPAPARTPLELKNYLEGYCTVRGPSCLSANPGNLSSEPLANAWQTLVDAQKKIVLPVFCGGPPTGACSSSAVVNAGGNNAIYPVQSLIGVQVCGYHWSNSKNGQAVTGDCAAYNTVPFNAGDGTNQDKYLLLRAVPITISEGDSLPGICAIGDPTCDFGLKQVFLTE
ncbi:pilus assembly protein TadG-related protein [Phycicoccus sp. Soil748]|uniref:pilus assembly protein TadG-related protein n=1 Tax=Phycicoccus sp. Soil748 TaxID=1736397 RepID=UPI00070367E9|nr:pilus assembly protein TadG-related protein [Phycicoccus sp. Soil748]KRE57167.1 hypothetical protein ASG70_01690 [Phycicoccus sp. Soil748]